METVRYARLLLLALLVTLDWLQYLQLVLAGLVNTTLLLQEATALIVQQKTALHAQIIYVQPVGILSLWSMGLACAR